MVALMGFSRQFDFTATLQQKLRLYYQRHIPVKIHLTFNQPKYAPGDTAYYKVNFFTANSFKPVSGRQIMNVNLIDGRGEVAHHAKLLLNDGVGFNQIPLPESIKPGRYSVVAFDEVMKDYDPSLFFQCPFWISGPVRIEERVEKNEIHFYPEGGHFIASITNKVVVEGPPDSSGAIISDDGREIASFILDPQGSGLFFLTPRKGEKYFASIRESDVKVPLPVLEDDGVGILATVPANNLPIRVTVHVPENSALKSEQFILALTAHEKIYYAANFSFNQNDFLNFAFPQDSIPEGIARLTIFKINGAEVGERLLYIKKSFRPLARIILQREEFLVREQIPMEISITDAAGHPQSSAFAVTVFQDDLLATRKLPVHNIAGNALLYGDLPGSLNNPVIFSPDPGAGFLSTDNFLIKQRWTRFTWEDVWKERLPMETFRKYQHLAGKVSTTDAKPLPDSTLITLLLQKSVMTYEGYVNASGEFDFSLLMDFYGEEEIFYKVESRGKMLHNAQVSLHPPVHVNVLAPLTSPLAGPDSYYVYARQKKEIDQSYSFHMQNRAFAEPPSLNALIEDEVFGADVIVNLGDYLLFPTMSETLREIVPMLQHRKNRNRDIVRLFFEDRNRFADEEPLFIVDGVITDHTTYILNLKPSDVVSIKLIGSFRKLQTFGSIGKNGMVLIETKIPGNAALVPRSDYTLKAHGLTEPANPHKMNLAKKDFRVPDLRSNLFWDPVVKTGSSGSTSLIFAASDVTGSFRIRIEGFTANGEPFFAEKTFQVSF